STPSNRPFQRQRGFIELSSQWSTRLQIDGTANNKTQMSEMITLVQQRINEAPTVIRPGLFDSGGGLRRLSGGFLYNYASSHWFAPVGKKAKKGQETWGELATCQRSKCSVTYR